LSEASRTILVAVFALAAGFTWQSAKTTLIPVSSPERLIAELRLSQVGALLLAMTGAAYIGFAVVHDAQPGVGIDVALAMGFFLVAATTLVRDPRHALTILAFGFTAHAMVDVAHQPGLLPEALTPRWYTIGCAVYNAYIGALCYLPILRR
jgi:hypothetical protein